MHIPDGFVNATTSAGAAVVAAGGFGVALRVGGRSLKDRQVPLAGMAAAFIFAVQMLNFPVAAGTSGHLLGAALAAILLGPSLGITVMGVVVLVQALIFSDGGISALGLNLSNMAVLAPLGGWTVFRLVGLILPKRRSTVMVATLAASWCSVVLAATAFAFEYSIGGRGGIDPGTVLGAMAGVHSLIGIGEGIITATVIGSVLAVRPDLVVGARRLGLEHGAATVIGRKGLTGFVAAGLAAAVVLVVFVAPLASSAPDGLERVAADTGFAGTATASPLTGPGYGIKGVADGRIGTVVAGMIGVAVTFAIGLALVAVVRRRRRRDHAMGT